MMIDEVVIWAIPEGGSYRLGCADAAVAPIPFGAEIVVRIDRCDKELMWQWIKKRVRRGWSLDKIRRKCQ